jgi:DNA recombination protein RmuC
MLNTISFLLFFVTALFIGVIFYFSKKFSQLIEAQKNNQGLQFLNQNLNSFQQSVAQSINQSTQAMNERLDNASRVIMAVNSELGQMREIGSNLKNIQNFLKSPKLRGNLGEQGLKELLSQALPKKYFDIQYTFRSGQSVDAIIHLEAGKIPIDSKFPLENFSEMLRVENEVEKIAFRRKFREDFKKHIQAIAKKYINPDEGTVDFAFMYIPSEAIYFEVVNNESDLFEFAAHNHIILSSPSTFFYYLRTLMLGLEGKRVNEMAKEILCALRTIKQQYGILGEEIGVLGKHIGNANKSMVSVSNRFSSLNDKISSVNLIENEENLLYDGETK